MTFLPFVSFPFPLLNPCWHLFLWIFLQKTFCSLLRDAGNIKWKNNTINVSREKNNLTFLWCAICFKKQQDDLGKHRLRDLLCGGGGTQGHFSFRPLFLSVQYNSTSIRDTNTNSNAMSSLVHSKFYMLTVQAELKPLSSKYCFQTCPSAYTMIITWS